VSQQLRHLHLTQLRDHGQESFCVQPLYARGHGECVGGFVA
jgi:hypothetical protein